MKTSFSRRDVLVGVVGASACAGMPSPRSDIPGFPLGVTAGDPTPTSILLVTRLEGVTTVTLTVRAGDAVVVQREVSADDAGFVHERVEGLTADTAYTYRFEGEGRSSEGRFQTAPAADATRVVTFGAVSCLRQTRPMGVLERVAETKGLDAFLLLGDTVYADGAVTLEDYRAKWREGLSLAPSVAMRAAHAVIATWDDHEILNDAMGEVVPRKQFDAAKKAFLEHLPVSTDAAGHLWRSFRFGKTAEVIVLDCRGERVPSKKKYVSDEQLNWLKDTLKASPCAFKVIMNSVPIGAFPGVGWQLFSPDRWEGYPAQRREVLSFIDDEKLSGVLWVSGDFHLGSAGRVSASGPGSTAIEVLVGPGSSDRNPATDYPGAPQWDFSTGTNTFSTLRLDPSTMEATVDFRDGAGSVLFTKAYSLKTSV